MTRRSKNIMDSNRELPDGERGRRLYSEYILRASHWKARGYFRRSSWL